MRRWLKSVAAVVVCTCVLAFRMFAEHDSLGTRDRASKGASAAAVPTPAAPAIGDIGSSASVLDEHATAAEQWSTAAERWVAAVAVEAGGGAGLGLE